MSQPILQLNPRGVDEPTKQAIAAVGEAIGKTGVVRRLECYPILDRGYFHEVQYADVDGSSTVINDDDPYIAITGATATITPPAGVAMVVHVTGEVGVTDTAATEAWASIWNGTVQTEMRKTLAANEHATIPLSFTESIIAETTYTLRAKKNAGGDSDYAAERSHLSIVAVPQTDRYSGLVPTWEQPVRIECGDREAVKGIFIASSVNRGHNATNYYRVRFGIRLASRVDWLGTWNGKTQDLLAGVPVSLTGTLSLDRVIHDDEVGVIEVMRTGEPVVALEGLAVQVHYSLVGG